jgi:hypothetical protein
VFGQIITYSSHLFLFRIEIHGIFEPLCQSPKSMNSKEKNTYKIRTEKKNKITIEEIDPEELKKIWEKLKELNQTL